MPQGIRAAAMTEEELTRAALLAIEEAVHTARYLQEPQSHAVRFALAYLHSRKPGDRRVFDEFWRALGEKSVSRGIALETKQKALHDYLGMPHVEADMWRVWRETFARLTTITGQGRRDPFIRGEVPSDLAASEDTEELRSGAG